MRVRHRARALTAVAVRGCFHLCRGLTNVANATRARTNRFGRVCGLSIVPVPAGHPVHHISCGSLVCGARHRGFTTVVGRITSYRGHNRPILLNAIGISASRVLSHVLHVTHVPRGILGTGGRTHRTRVIARTNRPKTIAVTAGVTNHNASVGLKRNII